MRVSQSIFAFALRSRGFFGFGVSHRNAFESLGHGQLSMTLALVSYISDHPGQVLLTETNHAVASLPLKRLSS